ncbi:MAG: hypothetical protein ACRC3B_04880 [Bacteroidia bacterium]
MRLRNLFLIAALFSFTFLTAQDLKFLGIEGVYFGMPEAELKEKVLIMDTTSSYTDTAFYLRSTTCHIYRRKTEKLQLSGFNASSVEFEFCDGKLVYVFVTVNGQAQTEAAFRTLKQRFPKLQCKKDPCTNYDSKSKKLRIIANNNSSKQEFSFVLIGL